tara:strand:- start:32722 stop:33135 length:414 start_codon:yes stop_codon:yes gene_type:complete
MSDVKFSYNFGDDLPKSLGLCTDHLKKVSKLRLAMQKEVDEVKKRETEIQEHIIEHLSASDDTGVSGKFYQSKVVTSEAASAEDWDKVYDFVHAQDRFDLLSKSLSQKAIKEMWEAGEQIPGVTKVNVKKLSITKVK